MLSELSRLLGARSNLKGGQTRFCMRQGRTPMNIRQRLWQVPLLGMVITAVSVAGVNAVSAQVPSGYIPATIVYHGADSIGPHTSLAAAVAASESFIDQEYNTGGQTNTFGATATCPGAGHAPPGYPFLTNVNG